MIITIKQNIYKVVKALQWEGGNSFRIIAKHINYPRAKDP